jgi:molecular chaperone GrpE
METIIFIKVNLSQTSGWQYYCPTYLCTPYAPEWQEEVRQLEKMAEKDMKNPENGSPDNPEDININTDENQSGTTHLNEPVAEESELESLRMELGEVKDKYLRKVAEFDNFRRRSAKERLELIQTAGRDVITEMLDVLDDCDRAQKQLEGSDDMNSLKEGIMLVFTKLRNTLQARGVKPMDTINQEFNPDLHEAITEIPAPTEALKGKVVDEVMKGYYLNDKIIRHAKVVVGK